MSATPTPENEALRRYRSFPFVRPMLRGDHRPGQKSNWREAVDEADHNGAWTYHKAGPASEGFGMLPHPTETTLQGGNAMENEGVFRRLEEMGATKAVVEFSGGNDEGEVHAIVLYAGDERLRRIREHYTPGRYDENLGRWVRGSLSPEKAAETELAEALSVPVYERYHSFAGDFHVHGTVTWEVEARRTYMDGYETVEHYESIAEEL